MKSMSHLSSGLWRSHASGKAGLIGRLVARSPVLALQVVRQHLRNGAIGQTSEVDLNAFLKVKPSSTGPVFSRPDWPNAKTSRSHLNAMYVDPARRADS